MGNCMSTSNNVAPSVAYHESETTRSWVAKDDFPGTVLFAVGAKELCSDAEAAEYVRRAGIERHQEPSTTPTQFMDVTGLAERIEAFRPLASGDARVLPMPRGGWYVRTKAGPVQVGMPPECIKDSFALGIQLPQYFVMPADRISRSTGLNVADFEFPTYFNFFVSRKRIKLMLRRRDDEILTTVFREMMVGPAEIDEDGDFHPSFPRDHRPDFPAELAYFRKNPFAPDKGLMEMDDQIEALYLDDDGCVALTDGDGHPTGVTLRVGPDDVVFYEDGTETARVPARIDVPAAPPGPAARVAAAARGNSRGASDARSPSVSSRNQRRGSGAGSTTTGSLAGGTTPRVNTAASIHRSGEGSLGLGNGELPMPWAMGGDMPGGPPASNGATDGGGQLGSGTMLGSRITVGSVAEGGADASVLGSFTPTSLAAAKGLLPGSGVSPARGLSPAPPHFVPPLFGVTFLGSSHGFDGAGGTTGFVIWDSPTTAVNGRGIVVDPPPNTSAVLEQHGVPPGVVDACIVTHCHSDHDAGLLQKLVTEPGLTVMTTRTVMASVVKKYAAVMRVSEPRFWQLFTYRRVRVGEPVDFHGARLHFFFSLHALPCMGIRVDFGGASVSYSGDTCYDPPRLEAMRDQGVISPGRLQSLLGFPFDSTIVLHEAGVPPIHTPLTALGALPAAVRARLYCVHVAYRNFPFESGLRIAQCGLEHTIGVPARDIKPAAAAALRTLAVTHLLNRCAAFKWAPRPLPPTPELLRGLAMARFSRGESLARAGTVSAVVYVLESGWAELVGQPAGTHDDAKSSAGALDFVDTPRLSYGDCVGLESGVTGAPEPATVLAATTVEAIAVPRSLFLALLATVGGQGLLVSGLMARSHDAWGALSANHGLRHLAPFHRAGLLEGVTAVDVAAGESLWAAGDVTTHALLIDSGELEMRAREGDAGAAPLWPGLLMRGTLLGSWAADGYTAEGAEHAHHLVAKTAAVVFRIPVPGLNELLREHPQTVLSFHNTYAVL